MSDSSSLDGALAFWLTENDYVRIDDCGYLIDRPREGAFGVVVPLWDRDFTRKRALKLPRLRGDTMDENARTWQMLEDEIVHALAATTSSLPTGLAKPNKDLKKLLKGIRAIRAKHAVLVDDVQKQPHIVLVSFENGKTPRLCAVSVLPPGEEFGISKLRIFPRSVKDDLTKTLNSGAKWQALELGNNDERFEIPAYCQSASTPSDGRLENALRPNEIGAVWYAGLPGLVYDWSESTLQESIDAGIIKSWSPTSVVKLFATLLGGLATLHKEMLHGDLRPANIMCVDGDMHDPSRYVLIDFGSFIDTTSRIDVQASPSNNTVLAARMIKNRISVFYSPERRQPFEVEGVTTAIIRQYASGHAVILGRESMLDSVSSSTASTFQIKPEVDELIKSAINETAGSNFHAAGVAVKGDLLRVQEKLLTIVEEKRVPDNVRAHVDRVLLCDKRVARIFNDRIAVLTEDSVDGSPISVSGYTIIPKMSVADDLYSFGSICLYVLLSKAFQDEPPERETVQAATNRAFVALMGTLDNVAYATAFWKTTEALRPSLEDLLKYASNLTAERAPTVFGFDANGAPIEVSGKEPPEDENLFDRSVEITNTILQNLPYGQHIYSALGKNTASFVLWMHFVICCLHRADSIKTELAASTLIAVTPVAEERQADDGTTRRETKIDPKEILPFCSSRADDLGENGPSARAKTRLDVVENAIRECDRTGILVKFRYESKAVFKPKSELQMRLQELDLRNEIDAAKRSEEQLRLELQQLKEKLDSPRFLALTLWQRFVAPSTPAQNLESSKDHGHPDA
jgi:serine/threonine protein kinase